MTLYFVCDIHWAFIFEIWICSILILCLHTCLCILLYVYLDLHHLSCRLFDCFECVRTHILLLVCVRTCNLCLFVGISSFLAGVPCSKCVWMHILIPISARTRILRLFVWFSLLLQVHLFWMCMNAYYIACLRTNVHHIVCLLEFSFIS